eukprot:6391462-Pyramimonas_sp.AAC.2
MLDGCITPAKKEARGMSGHHGITSNTLSDWDAEALYVDERVEDATEECPVVARISMFTKLPASFCSGFGAAYACQGRSSN